MVYGYTRISTISQTNNTSFAVQEHAIKEKYPDAIIYKEQFTGTKVKERPVLQEVISLLKNDDILVCFKLDRLARNTSEGITLIQNLIQSDVKVDILNIGLIDNSYLGKFYVTVLLAVCELEKNMIVERMQSGKEYCRQNVEGYKEGRPPKYKRQQKIHAMKLIDTGYTMRQVSEITGMSISTLKRIKSEYGLIE